jgi:hypothetical protein
MLRFSSFLVSAAVLLVTADAARSADRATYQVLDEGAAQLREDFNAAKGSVRVLFVVDPICPGCLRGLDDMNKDLLSKTKDPRLQTFVVHVPRMTPPPKAKDVPEAATLLHNDHVRHYWNPSGSFGEELSQGLGLKVDGEDVYAWDVWLVYGTDAVWDGTSPPKPEYFMHQLWALGVTDLPRFDSKVFAQRAHQLLASVPNP